MRRFVRRRPFGFLLYFLPVVLLWTYPMSYGAAVFGQNAFAVQYTPSIAFYVLALGVLIYPFRLLWVPALVYLFALCAPFTLPFVDLSDWYALLLAAPEIVGTFFFVNIVGAFVVGVAAKEIIGFYRQRLWPYTADLLLALLAQVVFLAVNLIMIAFFVSLLSSLPAEVQGLLGYDENYVDLALKRVFRGCAVILTFLLLFLHRPQKLELLYLLPSVFVFSTLGVVHATGYGQSNQIEAGLVIMVMALVLPQAIAPLALVIGVGCYAVLTGTFLSDLVAETPFENAMDYYGTALLNLGTYILALRGYVDRRQQLARDSIERLDAARDFAGVGIFQVNQTLGMVQLDPTSMRVMGVKTLYNPIDEVYARFAPESRQKLLEMGIVEPGQTYKHVLRVIRGPGDECMIRVFIWAQYAESGSKLAYGLVLDVTDEQATESALRHALADLEARDEKQRRMFSIISHEIRTPASVLAMLIEDLEPLKTGAMKPKLAEASHQLLGVLSDMRQAVNPEENLAIVKSPYVPSELAETVRNTYQAQSKKALMNIKLKLGAGSDVRRIGDQVRTKQLVGNLVRNALLHSRGRTVEIAFESQPDEGGQMWSVWTVRDDGIGIEADEVDRLFEPFERGGKDPRNQADGSGLGLYIAKTAVELLGGSITYIQRARGACYQIRLPEDIATEQVTAEPPEKEAVDLSMLHVLLVEDNPLVAEVTQTRLRKIFAEVSLARNGEDALAMAQATPPDLLITDLFMPKMEGDQLIRALKELDHDYVMIGLTAAAVGNDMDRFTDAGADLVMSKPLDSEALMEFLVG